MKYNKIFALAPESEKADYTDETANEGVWLSHAHMAAVDSTISTLEGKAGVPQEQHDKVVSELDAANKVAEENKTTISTHSARIAELEAENKKLGAQSSGDGTALEVVAEEQPKQKGKKVSLLDDAHPFNQAVDQHLEATKSATRISDFK